MSVKLISDVLHNTHGLTSGEKLVLIILADHGNSETGECFPSVDRICNMAGLSKRGVQKNLASLEKKNLITRRYRESRSTNYVMHLEGAEGRTSCTPPCTTVHDLPAPQDTHNQESNQDNNKNIALLSEFEQFWKKYPAKIGKAKAKTSYATARKKVDADVLLNAVDRYIKNKPFPGYQWAYPTTWLNQERWEDQQSGPNVDAPTKPFFPGYAHWNIPV